MPQRFLTLQPPSLKILVLLLWVGIVESAEDLNLAHDHERIHTSNAPLTHSCIHDKILEQQRRSGVNPYKVTPQVYGSDVEAIKGDSRGRLLLTVPQKVESDADRRQPIRIFLNYDAVGHSADRDCRSPGEIVKLGEPPATAVSRLPLCNSHTEPPLYGDCWYNCTLEDIAGDDKKNRLHKALEETIAWFELALSVERVKGPLRLSGYSACGQDGGVQLPREYVDGEHFVPAGYRNGADVELEGIENADLVLLVTTRPTTGNTLAWAVACERDQWGRAIAGHVNVAPRHLTAEAESLLSATLVHEIMHVLGFDPHAFAHFRDERKRRRTEVIFRDYDANLGRMVTRVVLPRVIMHSREHYGAFTENFKGLELEDGGGRGTAGSHWEKRLLMNEIMTGSVDTRSVVSSMTLALLEDSGWYKSNFSMADRLDWGRSQGVDFLLSRCDAWNGAYRCNSTSLSGCTYNREAEGYCPIIDHNRELPAWARYFPETNKGGQSSLADYCAYFVAYSDGSCIDTNSARPPDSMLGETRGLDSRCMASSLVRSGFVRGPTTQNNGCYKHRCVDHTLEVAVDGVWKKCPKEGGELEFPGFNGNLVCPMYHELCEDSVSFLPRRCPHNCHHNGDCIDGKCHCFLGFSGENCSQRVCPEGCSGHGICTEDGICDCKVGYTGVDCSTAGCDEQCSLHGGVCDDGVCEFRCSDYGGYTCQNDSALIGSLALCGEVLMGESQGQHCAPSESSILQQLEAAVVLPNYNRLMPSVRPFFNTFDKGYCATAAKRLACWISIQRCDTDGDNRLRVCHSACESYNKACRARLDCSDRTLFSGKGGDTQGTCTGDVGVRTWWISRSNATLLLLISFLLFLMMFIILSQLRDKCQQAWRGRNSMRESLWACREAVQEDVQGAYLVLTEIDLKYMLQNSRLPTPGSLCKTEKQPVRGSIRDFFTERTGQLSSRGSPRKADITY